MITRISSVIVVLAVLLAACSSTDWNERNSTPQQRELATRFIKAFREDKLDQLARQIDPAIYGQTVAQRDQIIDQVPLQGKPELVTVAANTTTDGNGIRTLTSLNYEFGQARRWTIFQVTLSTSGRRAVVVGWRTFPASQRPTTANAFTMNGAGAFGYLWLAMMGAAVLTCLAGAWISFRDRELRNRVLWIVGSLFGLMTFSLNWATGAIGFVPISFLFLGASAFKQSPFDPWNLSFAIPVVAIIALFRHVRSRSKEAGLDTPQY
jgi:hypothetical protein